MNEVLRDYRLRSLTVCQVRCTFEGWLPDIKGQGQAQEVQVVKVSTSGSSGLPGTSSIGSLLTLNKKKRNINGSRQLGKNDLTQEELMNTDTNPVGHLLILTCDRILLLQDKGCEGDDSFTLNGDHAHHGKGGEPQRLAPLVSGANEIFLSISLSQIVQVELCENGYGVEVEYADPSSKYPKSQSPLNDTDSDNDQSAEYGFPSPERFPILSALVSGARDALKRKLGSLSGKVSGSLQQERSLEGNVVRIVLHTTSLHTARNLKDAIHTTCRRFLEALLWLDRGLPTTVESVLTVATVSAQYASRLGDIVLGRAFAWGETLRISGKPTCIYVDLSTPLGARSCEINCLGNQERAILATEVRRLVLKTSKPKPRSGIGQDDKDHMVVYITVELSLSEQLVVGTPKETEKEVIWKIAHPAILDALPVRVVWNYIDQNEVEVLLFIISVLVLFVSMLSLRAASVSWLATAILTTNMVLSFLRIILRWTQRQQSHSPFDRTSDYGIKLWKTKQNHTAFPSNDQRKETYILLKFIRAEIVEDVHKANELAEPSSNNFSAELFETNAMIKDELPPIARKLSRTMSLPKALLMVEESGPENEGLIDIGAIAGSQRLVVSSPQGQNLTIFKTSSDSKRDEIGESNKRLQEIDGNLRPLTPQASHMFNSLESPRKKMQQSVDLSASIVTEEGLSALNLSRRIADLTEISPYITEDLFHRYLFACGGDSDVALDRLKATAEWRAENDIDKILGSPIPKFDLIKSAYLHTILGRTRDGLPVLLDGTGSFKSALSILRSHAVAPAEMVHQYIFIMEWVIQDLAPQPFPGGKYVRIYDLKGIGLLDVADQESMKLGQRLMEVVENHFPERMAKAFIINAPPFFSTLWNVVRPMLNPRTAAKISITRHKKATLAALRTLMDDDVIPAPYGGTSGVGLSPDDMSSWYCSPEERRLRDHVARVNSQ